MGADEPSAPELAGVGAPTGAGAAAEDSTQTFPAAASGPPTPSGDLAEPLPFPSWERYKIISLLGAGGMGSVYKAQDLRLERLVAIKFLRSHQLAAKERRQRRHFEREARAQASLNHPHICKIYEIGEVQGQPYIAMQFIDGEPLAARPPLLTREQTVRAMAQVAEALHSAHEKGIIHRDIKPGNIMIERHADGTLWPYLMDFGLARELDAQSSTTTGLIEGTPAFMSPEQAFGSLRRLDHRTDIYSLGATLYSTLTGRPLFYGSSMDVLFEVLTSDPVPPRRLNPSLPADLEIIILKCLEKQPERRYASARELAEDLTRHLAGKRIAARPPGLVQRLQKFARQHKLIVASVGAALVASLVLGGVSWHARRQAAVQAAAQARLAQELGQDIKEFELFMRAAYGLPLHDISREQGEVRRRMAQLQDRLHSTGIDFLPALHYALGRGHLVMHEYPEAQAALEQAWQRGYQTPEARTALGLVLGERYHRGTIELLGSNDKKYNEAKRKELESQYLKPALAYLGAASSHTDAPSYIKGLLAFFREQDAEAIRLAQRAQAEAPWLAEPLKLEGDVYQRMAVLKQWSGRLQEARPLLMRAAACHRAAAAISRSDSALHEAEATDWIHIMETDFGASSSMEELAKSAIEASERAITSSPRSALGYRLKAWALWLLGFAKLWRGQDSEAELKQSLELAQRAVALDPADWQTHYFHNQCLLLLSALLEERGEDYSELVRQAIAALQEVLKLNQTSSAAWGDLGARYRSLFVIKAQHGQLDEQLFAKSDGFFERAIQIDPTYATAYTDRALLYNEKAAALQRHGGDSTEVLAAALASAQRGLAIQKNFGGAYALSLVLLTKMEFMDLTTSVPAELFSQAKDAVAQASALDSLSVLTVRNYAGLHLLQARSDLHAGRNPMPAVNEGLQAVLAGEKRVPKNYALALDESGLYRIAGQALRSDPRADDFFAKAAAAAQRAVALAPKLARTHEALCESLRQAAAARIGRRQLGPAQAGETADWIARGLRACTAALAIDPSAALAYGNRGALLLLQARRTADSAARRTAAVDAVQALEQALAINKWLRRDYGPVLAAARSLSALPPAAGSIPGSPVR